MEPTLSSFDQRIKDSVDVHSAEAERKSMIREVQSLVKRLHALEANDIDLKDSASRAAESLDRVVEQIEAIALATKPPIKFDEWDREYFAEISVGDRCICVLRVNPSIDSIYTQDDWRKTEDKELMISHFARRKFLCNVSVEVTRK